MATLTEGARNAQFIVSEANGYRSRGVGMVTVPANTELAAGTVLGRITASGKFVRHDSDLTNGAETAAAILYANLRNDGGAPVDFDTTLFLRDAEVTGAHLTYEDGAEPADIAVANAALAALGLIVR